MRNLELYFKILDLKRKFLENDQLQNHLQNFKIFEILMNLENFLL